MKPRAFSQCVAVVLMTLLVAGGGLTTTHDAMAQTGAPDEAASTSVLIPPGSPPVQVTTDPANDERPALVQTADGKLLTVFARYGGLWSRSSMDGGATWTDERQITGCCVYNYSLARVGVTLWLAYDVEKLIEIPDPSGGIELLIKNEIWYRTSSDGGVTWSAESKFLTDATDSDRESNPTVYTATDGKLWVVWQSRRGGNLDLWYKTSPDGGVTWSADARLTTSGEDDHSPTMTQAPDGRMVVVWSRWDTLWQRTSTDGITWSSERQIVTRGHTSSLAAAGGSLWLAYELEGDVWYRTSANQGVNWSAATQFTRFVAGDGAPALAVLTDGTLRLVWHSFRSSNWDIWFGSEDPNPPPYVEWIAHRPQRNPDSDDVITFAAFALDETGVANVSLLWTLDGVAQPDLPMFDDGMHGDTVAGDGEWSIQHEPLPALRQVTYSACATDTDGNRYCHPGWGSFTVLPPFIKTADILFVPDAGGSNTDGFRSYYTDALDAQGYKYDIWDTGLRSAPGSAILDQYAEGIVIWSVPSDGYVTWDSTARAALQAYLDNGGKLLITGQNIARYLSRYDGAGFLNDYLHAAYWQDDSGLYDLVGTPGDPIGDGLTLNISGGDGANNQYSKDVISPVSPAQAIFTYQSRGAGMLAEPLRPAEMPPPSLQDTNRLGIAPDRSALPATSEPTAVPATPLPPTVVPVTPVPPTVTPAPPAQANAAVRVDTGTYRVVYLAFGFEGINSAAYRAAAMERAVAWLAGRPARPAQLMPAYDQTVQTGDISFSWISVLGAQNYRIQIDTVATFDSPRLIDKMVVGTSYTHSFTTLGMHYWRVRAEDPEGAWTFHWPFSVSATVTQVTTDRADDTTPALAETAAGNLLSVFVRKGQLGSRASTDGGATWEAEKQIAAGCCSYNPSLARATDGTLWLAYDRDGDIWYRTSANGGNSWLAEKPLTTHGAGDYDPVVFQAADGKLWVVWQSSRAEYYSIWYKTSANNGATWSADTKLSSDYENYAPAAAAMPDGRVVVVWRTYNGLRQRSSADGGATWSEERQIADWGCARPGLAAAGQDLWLVYEKEGDIWYRTSPDGGDTWPPEQRFTRFVGPDSAPAAAALASGGIGLAWTSERSSNPDIWYGSPGGRDDINPPPYVSAIEHQPQPNPDSDDAITFRAWAVDEAAVVGVYAVVVIERAGQPGIIMEMPMYDDGTHGDGSAGDGVWGANHAPLAEGSRVTYLVIATDAAGNRYRYPGQGSFTVLPRFAKTAPILFVADAGGNNTPADTAWFRPYYTAALDALGYRYDTWDTATRGEPTSAILNQYTNGVVIWAVPYWGYVTENGSASISALKSYLNAGGGNLLISGQNIAQALQYSWYDGRTFLNDYLHVTLRQEHAGLYALAGAAGDPIGNGLALNISGGDGANNQYSLDEVDPITLAEVVFTYQAGVSAMLV